MNGDHADNEKGVKMLPEEPFKMTEERKTLVRKLLGSDSKYYTEMDLSCMSRDTYTKFIQEHREAKKNNWFVNTSFLGTLSAITVAGFAGTVAGPILLPLWGFTIYSAYRMKRAHEDADKPIE